MATNKANLLTISGISAGAIITFLMTFGALRADNENTKKELQHTKRKIERLEDDVRDVEKNVSVQQNQSQNVSRQLEEIKEQSDKVLNILLQLKNTRDQ